MSSELLGRERLWLGGVVGLHASRPHCLDEHRAVNYLAMRYPAIYSLVIDNYGRDQSLQGVGISPVSTRSQRRLVDVTLRFVSRKTDVRELYAARVDVTGMFPFMVTPLRPVFEKD